MFSKAQKKYPPEYAVNPYTEAYDAPTFYDSREFKAYCRLVEQVVADAGRPLCTREIHDLLGPERSIRRWTADALERSHLRQLPGLVDRWCSASVAEGRVAEGRVAEGRVAEGRTK